MPETGRYRLGPHLLQLANHVSGRSTCVPGAPHLEALEAATGETATLSIPGEGEAVTVDFVASRASVASVARVGRPSVAHATATGKVMLAFSRRPGHRSELEAFTDRTIVDAKRLRREIDEVREQGYAQAVKEREADLNALAAPIFGAAGDLVGILGLQGRRRVRAARRERRAARAARACRCTFGGAWVQ